jgi:hypothetical protein
MPSRVAPRRAPPPRQHAPPHLSTFPPLALALALALVAGLAPACGGDALASSGSEPGPAAPGPQPPPGTPFAPAIVPGPGPLTAVTRTLPDSVGGSASVVWHSGNGHVYVSTNLGYLLELDATTLQVLRTRRPRSGLLHQLTSDGTSLFLHYGGDHHFVVKVRPSDLAVLATSSDLGGPKSPEGFVFLGGSVYISIGGPPGKIVRLSSSTLAKQGEWKLPNGIENHGLTTDGVNLFILGVPTRGTTPSKYFKVSPGFTLLRTITFAWNGMLAGNVFHSTNGSIYTSPGRIARINPGTFTVTASSSYQNTTKALHWLASDGRWLYALDYRSPSAIRIFDPVTLKVVATQTTGTIQLHYGRVQNGKLWTASEQVPGVVQRWTLYTGAAPTLTGALAGMPLMLPTERTAAAMPRDGHGNVVQSAHVEGCDEMDE